MNYSIIVKRIGIFILLLIPAIAFGQSSSQFGPLHLPFEFKITVNGVMHPCESSPYPPDTSFGFDWIINPGDTNYHINNDTITYANLRVADSAGPIRDSSYFRMVFDTTTKTILDLMLMDSYSQTEFLGGTDYFSYLELINLDYDSTSIFTPDSDLNNHLISANYYYYYSEEPSGNPPPYCENLAFVTSANLSGNFRSATLTEAVAVPIPVVQPGMSFVNDNGIELCTFAPADHLRELELYTPLGVKAASFEIPAVQGEILLPHLTSGLYFVRMESNILKIAVP